MTITRAIEHLKWKYGNKWNPTQTDADALNTIIKFTEDKHKKQLHDYHLFAKLYVMVYAQFLDKYKATVFDDIPKKELTKYLNTPLENIIQRFTDKLNESELYTIFDLAGTTDFDHIHISRIEEIYKEKGYDDVIVKQKTEKIINQRKETSIELEKLLENHQDIKDYLYKGKEIWDYETVKDNLEVDINNTINLLK
jgi:hypothetical protein